MGHTRFVNTAFDPDQCPLLRGLSPEEQQRRMVEDPLIRQCVGHVDAKGAYPSPCAHIDVQPVTTDGQPPRSKAAAAA